MEEEVQTDGHNNKILLTSVVVWPYLYIPEEKSLCHQGVNLSQKHVKNMSTTFSWRIDAYLNSPLQCLAAKRIHAISFSTT